MKVCGRFSFNDGIRVIQEKYPNLMREIEEVIARIDVAVCKTKGSKKVVLGRRFFDPKLLNTAFKNEFFSRQWRSVKIECDYRTSYYTANYEPAMTRCHAFREMDLVKDGLAVEMPFGKYASVVYSGCAKMTIFHNLGFIDAGIEIVPIEEFADEMSTGVSYFEQFVWDLEKRGVSNIDIPVLILGIAA